MPGKVFLGRSGVAATEHPLASLAACRAMQDGGNAFDGAAAASFVLGVTQPHLNGLGGDFFGLFYLAKERRVYCLNSSGWSFSSMTVESLGRAGHRTVPRSGPASVVVPGHVAGVHVMQQRFGALEFSGVGRRDAAGGGGVPYWKGARQVSRGGIAGAVGGGEADLRGRRRGTPGRRHPETAGSRQVSPATSLGSGPPVSIPAPLRSR